MRVFSGLSYANVMSTLALFVALGGTGYAAITLPRNSVGARELRARSVGHSELHGDAVTSANVRDGSLNARDLSAGARASLSGKQGPSGPAGKDGATGPQGPMGVTGSAGAPAVSYWEVVSDVRFPIAGNAHDVTTPGGGQFLVSFDRSVAGCAAVASLAHVSPGLNVDPPAGASIDVQTTTDGNVLVRTYDPAGAPAYYGFHLIVAC